MKALGEINRGMVALILALVLGGGGYLWYSQMYTPAVELRTAAQGTASTAQQSLVAAEGELQTAKQNYEDSRKVAAKGDDSVARLQLATQAIPNKPLLDEAPLVLMTLAERTGIQTSFDAGTSADGGGGTGAESGAAGASGIDLQFQAVGTYGEMMNFINQVEDTVTVDRGKLHARGRLFNVVGLQIGTDENAGGDGASTDENAIVPKPGDITFTLVIRMYVAPTASTQALGEATPDAAAAGATGAAATADPNAAGGVAAPSADGSIPAADGTTPAAGAATGTDTSATPGTGTGAAGAAAPAAGTGGI